MCHPTIGRSLLLSFPRPWEDYKGELRAEEWIRSDRGVKSMLNRQPSNDAAIMTASVEFLMSPTAMPASPAAR